MVTRCRHHPRQHQRRPHPSASTACWGGLPCALPRRPAHQRSYLETSWLLVVVATLVRGPSRSQTVLAALSLEHEETVVLSSGQVVSVSTSVPASLSSGRSRKALPSSPELPSLCLQPEQRQVPAAADWSAADRIDCHTSSATVPLHTTISGLPQELL